MKLEMSLPQRPGLIYTMPVLDILVLVLIFPLIGSSFSTEAGVQLQDTSHRFERMEQSIILTIKGLEQREIYINRRLINEEDLLDELKKEAQNWKRASIGIIYRVDKQVPSGYKDKIADLLLEEGYRVYNAGNPAGK